MLVLDIQNSVTKMKTHSEELGVDLLANLDNSVSDFLRNIGKFKANRTAFYSRLMVEKINIIKAAALL